MINFKQIYESIIDESIKDDAIKKFNLDSDDAMKYVNKFWNEIRHKENDPQKKDINYWLKQGFGPFVNYIHNFKSNRQIKKDSKNLTEVDNGKGKLLSITNGYELWKVDSYEASKYLGRFYKNISTEWCISTDNKHYWKNYYHNDDSRFYFLIKQDIKKYEDAESNRYDKICIEVSENQNDVMFYAYWDMFDNDDTENNDVKKYNQLPKNIQNIIKANRNKIVWYDRPINDDNDVIAYINKINDLILTSDTNIPIIIKLLKPLKNIISLERIEKIFNNSIRYNKYELVKFIIDNFEVNIKDSLKHNSVVSLKLRDLLISAGAEPPDYF